MIRRARLPLVFWLHTAGDGRHWLERWARRLVPDLAIANSQFTSTHLARWFKNAPLETIYCPVRLHASAAQDLRLREDIRRTLDTAREDVVIVQVGRLESGKGNREALEAMATLRDVDGWKYWLVGGPQRDSDERYFRELKEIVWRHGMSDRVRFAGSATTCPRSCRLPTSTASPVFVPRDSVSRLSRRRARACRS